MSRVLLGLAPCHRPIGYRNVLAIAPISMTSTQPPTLRYFVVYNSSLKPQKGQHETAGSPSAVQEDTGDDRTEDVDDEDVEEQAQILFYTAKDHAVSRDRVLRQVGLAKALVNFSTCVPLSIGLREAHLQLVCLEQTQIIASPYTRRHEGW